MTMFAPPSMDDYLSPIEIFLVREVDMEPRNGRSGYTLGRLYYGANPDGKIFTREDQDRRLEEGGAKEFSATAIPIGRYEMYLYDTMLFGDIPVFKDVPGFSYCGIQPKSGNESLLGCVEVGEYRTLNGVSCSEGVLHKLRAMMRKAKTDGRKVFCTITRGLTHVPA